jgi:multidrug resistance efflux pump
MQIGQPVLIKIEDSGHARWIHGVVSAISEGDSAAEFSVVTNPIYFGDYQG